MHVVGLSCVVSVFLVGAVVGTRLLLVARRTRQLPELAIGLGLLCITCLGLPFTVAGRLPATTGTPVGNALFVFGLALSCSGIGCLYVFTWKVFRSTEAWATGLLLAAWVALAAELAGLSQAALSASTLAEILPRTRPWACGIVATVMVGFSWTSLESWLYYRTLRRRLQLGLADPVVANRFLLWAVSGATVVVLCGGLLAALLRGQAVLLEPSALGLIAISGLVTSTGWYLAFLPPAGYTRRIRSRAEAAPDLAATAAPRG